MLCPFSKGCCGQGLTLSNIKYSKENVFLASISDRIHHEGKIKKNCFFGNRIIKGEASLSGWHWREQSRWKCKKEWKVRGVAQKGPRSNWRLELTDRTSVPRTVWGTEDCEHAGLETGKPKWCQRKRESKTEPHISDWRFHLNLNIPLSLFYFFLSWPTFKPWQIHPERTFS